MPAPTPNTVESIIARCQVIGDCWLWIGGIGTGSRNAYGVVAFRGKLRLVHQLLYEELVGPIPDGHELHHTCENSLCANPAHLEPITHIEHLSERHYGTHCPQGHDRSPANAGLRRNGRRYCKACAREAMARKRQNAIK